jgi:hypothetical protein
MSQWRRKPRRYRWRRDEAFRNCITQKVGMRHDEAERAAERIMANGDVEPMTHVSAYHCHECGFWHTGTKHVVFRWEM